jgi:hypothetical protein
MVILCRHQSLKGIIVSIISPKAVLGGTLPSLILPFDIHHPIPFSAGEEISKDRG